jgi:hypothetical protein
MTLRTVDYPCTATGHLTPYCVVNWLILPFLSTLFTGSYGS